METIRRYAHHAVGAGLMLTAFTVISVGAVIGWQARGAYDSGRKVSMATTVTSIALTAEHPAASKA